MPPRMRLAADNLRGPATGRVGHLGGPAAGQLDHDAACQTVFLSVVPVVLRAPAQYPQRAPAREVARHFQPCPHRSIVRSDAAHATPPAAGRSTSLKNDLAAMRGLTGGPLPGAAPLPYSWPGRCSVPPQGEGDGI